MLGSAFRGAVEMFWKPPTGHALRRGGCPAVTQGRRTGCVGGRQHEGSTSGVPRGCAKSLQRDASPVENSHRGEYPFPGRALPLRFQQPRLPFEIARADPGQPGQHWRPSAGTATLGRYREFFFIAGRAAGIAPSLRPAVGVGDVQFHYLGCI